MQEVDIVEIGFGKASMQNEEIPERGHQQQALPHARCHGELPHEPPVLFNDNLGVLKHRIAVDGVWTTSAGVLIPAPMKLTKPNESHWSFMGSGLRSLPDHPLPGMNSDGYTPLDGIPARFLCTPGEVHVPDSRDSLILAYSALRCSRP